MGLQVLGWVTTDDWGMDITTYHGRRGGGYILPQYVKQLGIQRNLKATLETNYFSSHILKRAKQAAKSLIHKII